MSFSRSFPGEPIINTANVEIAELQLSRSLLDLEILNVADSGRFFLEMKGVNFESTSLLYNRYRTDTEIRSKQPGECLLFTVGYGEPASFSMNGEVVTVSSTRASVVSPHNTVTVNRPGGSEIVVVRVPVGVLHSHFEKLTDQYQQRRLVFAAGLDLGRGTGAMFRRTLDYILNEIQNNELADNHLGLTRLFDHMILTTILNLPHNLNHKLSTSDGRYIAPGVVRTAEEYIEGHLLDPLTITDLVKVCKCSKSSLFSAFQKTRGYTPMEFLVERRLQMAKKKLSDSHKNVSVASIALESGFTHLGRFSQSYRQRFGETPSSTRRKHK